MEICKAFFFLVSCIESVWIFSTLKKKSLLHVNILSDMRNWHIPVEILLTYRTNAQDYVNRDQMSQQVVNLSFQVLIYGFLGSVFKNNFYLSESVQCFLVQVLNVISVLTCMLRMQNIWDISNVAGYCQTVLAM